MLPFDLKISRSPEDLLETGLRIWYGKTGYSFPLRYDMGRLCSDYDDQVLDLDMTDPHLLFISVSPIKERQLGTVDRAVSTDILSKTRAPAPSSTAQQPLAPTCRSSAISKCDSTHRRQSAPSRHSRPARIRPAGRCRAPSADLCHRKDRGLRRRRNPTVAARPEF